MHALSFEPAPVKKERGFQFTVHEEGEKRLPAWALLICPHVLFPRLPIRCALEDQLSSRIHDSESLEIRAPANPKIRNLGTRNPGTRKPKNSELGNENMGTRTWKCGNPEHGCPNLETQKLGNQNVGIRNTDTRHMEHREPGKARTWECGNLRGPVKRHDLGQTTTCRVSMGWRRWGRNGCWRVCRRRARKE